MMLNYLFLNGFNPDVCACDSKSNTPLSKAYKRWDEKMVVLLYSMDGENMRLPDPLTFHRNSKYFAARILCRACVVGQLYLVAKLYDGYKKTMLKELQKHPIHAAVLADKRDVLRFLDEIDPELNFDMSITVSNWRPMEIAESLG
jgi:hypothetical protein